MILRIALLASFPLWAQPEVPQKLKDRHALAWEALERGQAAERSELRRALKGQEAALKSRLKTELKEFDAGQDRSLKAFRSGLHGRPARAAREAGRAFHIRQHEERKALLNRQKEEILEFERVEGERLGTLDAVHRRQRKTLEKRQVGERPN